MPLKENFCSRPFNELHIEEDGKVYITCNEDNPDYLDWVAEGNTAEEADKVKDAD